MTEKTIKVLCVEDDDLDRMILKRAVKSSGMNIELTFAEDLESGKEKTIAQEYDCIFLDYNLPGGSGLELLQFIRQNNNPSPVIIVTSQGDEKIAVEAMKNGASDYIPKNLLTSEGLSQSLRFVLKMREAEREKIRIQRELVEIQQRLETVVANSPIILFLLDLDGNLTLFEGKGLHETSADVRSQTGKPLESVAGIIPVTREDFRKACQGAEHNAIGQVGNSVFELFYSPMKNDAQQITGVIGVASDITNHKLAEEELKKAKQFAEDTARLKEQFLANMSHEIRTPMNGIMGLTRILLGTSVTEEQLRYLTSIKTCTDNLLVIINDILDLSKIEAGKMNFEKVAFSIKDIISQTFELFEPKAREKKLSLEYQLDKDIPAIVMGDPTRLSQITNNLVSNALKFTNSGGVTVQVKLRSMRQDNITLDFDVKDTGIGIPAQSLKTIFDSFTQASSDTTRKFGGTGLGLTIVKRLVELQGGRIAVRSSEGQGTTFSFQLVFSLASREEIERAVTNVDSVADISHLKVLVAEDNKINQMIVRKIFSDWGVQLEVADNGRICVEKLMKGNFDLVLMDIQMPEMDGNAAARMIRHELSEPFRSIPIMAMTAHATATEKQKCFESGMNDYISKPFDPSELRRKVVELASKIAKQPSGATTRHNPENRQQQAGNAPSKVTEGTGSTVPAEREVTDEKINLNYLNQIGGNNPEFTMQMIELFLQKTPEALEEMDERFRQQSWEELKNIAHRIKPSFTYVGLNGIHKMLAEIESNSTTQTNLESIPVLLNHVRRQAAIAYKELEAELARLK